MRLCSRVLMAAVLGGISVCALAQGAPAGNHFPIALPSNLPMLPAAEQARMDRDLMEITIPQLHELYAKHSYTIEQVVRWYLGRIARYNAIYKPLQTVDAAGALAVARAEDHADVAAKAGPLWGVPIVIKANTAVKGLPDTDGWQGFAIEGHAFVAPKDATVVAKLRAAGAVILGISNMPDFAASDTNRSTVFGRTGNAYDVRFSPGGSSGGTVTAVTENMAVLGNGTDTGNSIRMPAGTSAVVGVFPTRGLVSIAGIAPLDWLLDNTGPIARDVTDAAIALDVMAGEDPLDFKTAGSAAKAQTTSGPSASYTQFLRKDALKGKRFGVPGFILTTKSTPLQPETKAMLMKAVEQLRAAGATVVFDDDLLPNSFLAAAHKINTNPYRRDGASQWLHEFGPAEYKSADEYKKATGKPLPPVFTGEAPPLEDLAAGASAMDAPPTAANAPSAARGSQRWRNLPVQVALQSDPDAEKNYFGPQKAAIALYREAFDRFHLDGLVYPSAQMPPPDETMPQDGKLSSGPHSETGWVNALGVPAVVVPDGFYPGGLPFGLEFSARPWHDGDMLGWAFAFEQATRLRRPPVLVESGLLPVQ
ncbi:MAG TPA: amidase [Acidobacteriaceae bacterium]|jgi:aspartyl-tRNA(Asn)/glutamyl-tRNA(Gln) amidotransferase subunit A